MNFVKQLILSTLALGLSAPAISGTGLYGRLEGGVQSTDTSGVITGLPIGGFFGLPYLDTKSDPGFAGYAAIGGELAGLLSLEAELGYSSESLSKATDISQLSVMANALLHLEIFPGVTGVVGAGAGFTNYSWDTNAVGFPPSFGDQTDWAFAYQAILGLDVGIDDQIELSVRFRHKEVTDADMKQIGWDLGAGLAAADVDALQSQSLTIGLKFAL